MFGEIRASIEALVGNDHVTRRVLLRVIEAAQEGRFQCMRTFVECLSERNKEILRAVMHTHGVTGGLRRGSSDQERQHGATIRSTTSTEALQERTG